MQGCQRPVQALGFFCAALQRRGHHIRHPTRRNVRGDGNHALGAGQYRLARRRIVAAQDHEVLRAGRDELTNAADLRDALFETYDPRKLRQTGDGRRQKVHGGTRRDVVQNHRVMRDFDGRGEVPVEPLLSRSVVRRSDQEESRDRKLRDRADTLNSHRGTAGSCPYYDRDAPVDMSAREPRQLEQLGFAQIDGFAGAATHDDGARAVGEMKIEESLPRRKIDSAVRPHGRDDGDQTT